MSNVLIINAVLTPEESSNTMILQNHFIKEYKLKNPNDKIEILKLYESDVDLIDKNMYMKMASGEENNAKKHAQEFLKYDKLVFVAPMWNLSVPATLKAYIDYITYAGITFKYGENGPVGLVENSKALFLTSCGGVYTLEHTKQFDVSNHYLKTILGFLGVEDYQTVSFEGTNLYKDEMLLNAQQSALSSIDEIIKTF